MEGTEIGYCSSPEYSTNIVGKFYGFLDKPEEKFRQHRKRIPLYTILDFRSSLLKKCDLGLDEYNQNLKIRRKWKEVNGS